MRTLTAEEAKAFYDRLGRAQDSQSFYERRALDALIANAALARARTVFEFGCGTGQLALELLRRHLPASARYVGVDLSTTMVRLAGQRIAAFAPRASVATIGAGAALPLQDGTVDRFVSTYVLDLLSRGEALRVLAEAHRALARDGLLCLAGITGGTTPVSRLVMRAWDRLFALRPSWVGGCRPVDLGAMVSGASWQVRFHETVVAWGVASEVLVAAPVGDPRAG